MIQRLIVKKLNGRYDFDLNFHSDLNVITGKNGTGKTTLLKLMWYLVSGNLVTEIDKSIFFESLEVHFQFLNRDYLLSFNNKDKWGVITDKITNKIIAQMPPIPKNLLNINTIFFPTFRREEGGYHIHQPSFLTADDFEPYAYNYKSFVEAKHTFIKSISTFDIDALLIRKYAQISDKIVSLDKIQSEYVLKTIEEKNKSGNNENQALDLIQKKVSETKLQKEAFLKPFATLSKIVEEVFIEKGIRISDTILLGNPDNAIESDKLSAGEKQMFSFLAYGMFAKDTIIFIDEPELSLHTDWQEILLPTLMEFSNGNQFFVATHSPFIYYKYPDKEIILNPKIAESQEV